MCVIFISYNQRSDFPLILAANRDEFYNRPTAPAAY
ncbi:MAG: NRDE family protein, partial [Acidobacteriota bacterium]|nr:NRDE family protein [Acidobacteriota bacterium]